MEPSQELLDIIRRVEMRAPAWQGEPGEIRAHGIDDLEIAIDTCGACGQRRTTGHYFICLKQSGITIYEQVFSEHIDPASFQFLRDYAIRIGTACQEASRQAQLSQKEEAYKKAHERFFR